METYIRPKYRVEKIDDKLVLVTHEFEDGEPVRFGNTFQTHGTGNLWAKNLGAVKIVGEISPEATWVKEGNEFDEEEVQECWLWNHSTGSIVLRKHEGSEIDKRIIKKEHGDQIEFKTGYLIKGPCGHFH
jgi:hypothetical protein